MGPKDTVTEEWKDFWQWISVLCSSQITLLASASYENHLNHSSGLETIRSSLVSVPQILTPSISHGQAALHVGILKEHYLKRFFNGFSVKVFHDRDWFMRATVRPCNLGPLPIKASGIKLQRAMDLQSTVGHSPARHWQSLAPKQRLKGYESFLAICYLSSNTNVFQYTGIKSKSHTCAVVRLSKFLKHIRW